MAALGFEVAAATATLLAAGGFVAELPPIDFGAAGPGVTIGVLAEAGAAVAFSGALLVGEVDGASGDAVDVGAVDAVITGAGTGTGAGAGTEREEAEGSAEASSVVAR